MAHCFSNEEKSHHIGFVTWKDSYIDQSFNNGRLPCILKADAHNTWLWHIH